MNKKDLETFTIEDRIITQILDEYASKDLGIEAGYQILKIDGKSIPTCQLGEYLNSKDDFEFEIQVKFLYFLENLKSYPFYFVFDI